MRIMFTVRQALPRKDGEALSYTTQDYITDNYPLIEMVPGSPLTSFRIPAPHQDDCPEGCWRPHSRVASPMEVTSGRHVSDVGIVTSTIVAWRVLDPLWANTIYTYAYPAEAPDDWQNIAGMETIECLRNEHELCPDASFGTNECGCECHEMMV